MLATVSKIVKLVPANVKRKLPKKISIIKVDERTARELNHRYRRKNKPANVLSFRYSSEYGEVVLCPAVIQREAKRQGNSYSYQKRWMTVHGLLHLAGVHHEKSAKARKRFEEIENRILKE